MILRVLLVVVLGSSGATLAQAPAGEPDRDPRILVQTDLRVEHPSAVRDAIEAVLVTRTAAWNAANLVRFCEAYAEDALLLTSKGVTRGRRAVLERYEKTYADAGAMGVLTLTPVEIREAPGTDPRATTAVSVAARWTLAYPDRPEASGLTLLVFHRIGSRWLIVQDASM